MKSPRLMQYDPATRAERPFPSEAMQYRDYHGTTAWLYNPYSGRVRDARDVGSDTFGLLIKDADCEKAA